MAFESQRFRTRICQVDLDAILAQNLSIHLSPRNICTRARYRCTLPLSVVYLSISQEMAPPDKTTHPTFEADLQVVSAAVSLTRSWRALWLCAQHRICLAVNKLLKQLQIKGTDDLTGRDGPKSGDAG
jgi:hypothetical protein